MVSGVRTPLKQFMVINVLSVLCMPLVIHLPARQALLLLQHVCHPSAVSGDKIYIGFIRMAIYYLMLDCHVFGQLPSQQKIQQVSGCRLRRTVDCLVLKGSF